MSIPYMVRSYSYESWAPDTLPDTELTPGSSGSNRAGNNDSPNACVYSTYSRFTESTYIGRGPQSNGANLVLQGGQMERGMACTAETHTRQNILTPVRRG